MLKDCGLIAETSLLPQSLEGKARQIFTVEIDLLFKQVCKQVSNTKQAYAQLGNVIQDYSILESNRSKFLRSHIHGSSQRDDFKVMSNLTSPVNRPKSGVNRGQTDRSFANTMLSPQGSHRSIRLGSTSRVNRTRDRSGSFNRGDSLGRGGSLSRTRQDAKLDKFDFPCFIAFLIKLGPKVYP